MKQALITLLETFGYPVRQQGSLVGTYPDSFFTFWNDSADDGSHYDNDPINYVWRFTVYFFSTDPLLVDSKLIEAKSLLKANNWIVPGKGYDTPSDEQTHTGRAIDCYFVEKNSEE